MDTCTSGEVYNMIIRGGNEGGLDGIDVWRNNIHVHDVEVTNKDECVTVKVVFFPRSMLHEINVPIEPSIKHADRKYLL